LDSSGALPFVGKGSGCGLEANDHTGKATHVPNRQDLLVGSAAAGKPHRHLPTTWPGRSGGA